MIRMRPAALIGESVRNVLTGATRAVILAIVWAGLLATLTVSDAIATQALLVRAAEFQSSGAATVVVTAPGRVDGAACELLSRRETVASAGALRAAPVSVEALVSPGVPVPTSEATAGLVDQLTGAPLWGLLLSADAARSLGVVAGDPLDLDQGATTVSAVFDYPDDGRRAGLGYSALVTVPAVGLFDECWATSWPLDHELPGLLASVVTPAGPDGEEMPTVVAQLNQTQGADFAGEALYRSRPTAGLPVLAIAGGLVIGGFGVRLRRLELASARHVGVTVADQTIHVSIEACVWITAGAIAALLLAAIVAPAAVASEPAAIGANAALIAASGCLAALAGTIGALATESERRFVRYFRNRA